MATFFLIVLLAALAAAAFSWGLALAEGVRFLAARKAGREGVGAGAYALLAVWPFAVRPRSDAAGAPMPTSKAMLAFGISLMVAVAATSVYTNLTFKRPLPAPEGSPSGASGATSSKG